MTNKRRRLAARCKSLGFTQEAFAERLDVDTTTVRRWETGVASPQPWLRPKIARHMQVSHEQLDALLAEIDEGAQAHDRIAFALRHPRSVDLLAIAELRGQIHALDERYDREPSTLLLAETGQCLGQIAFLRGNAASNRIRRELYAVEAESATLMGQLVWDASQRRDNTSAHRYFDQAVVAARQVRDPVAESFALLRKSFVALYGEQDAARGLDLCERTASAAVGESDVLSGLAMLHAAEAHAMLGDKIACEGALAQADTHFGRVDEGDAAADLFSPTQPGRLAGSCYLFLGKPKRAMPVLEATAQQMGARSKSQAIVLGNLGLAYIRQDEVDSATAMLHRAIDVIEQTWGGGGLNVVFSACRELQPWRDLAVVQDVYDRAMALMTTRPTG
ncbi:MAG: helix-turn-helix transcriptional regulator [Actinomycetota bacterium]|nr:helix-turn-helix transcriptional regulator [Actinomycetota bacterium]